MGLLDFILNIAALLLWLNAFFNRTDSLAKTPSVTLLGTLRKADPRAVTRWKFLGTLAFVIFIRGIVYWQISTPLRWTPHLNLGVITLYFRTDPFWHGNDLVRAMLFSELSFALFLAEFYFWLLLLSAINGTIPDKDPVQKLVRSYVKWIERYPGVIKLLIPFVAGVAFWLALHPLLAAYAGAPPSHSVAQLFKQAAIIGGASYLSWKYLLVGILLLHLLNSYVYLGTHPFWNFLNASARNLLYPLRWIPLRIGKVDFLPVIVVALVFLVTESITNPTAWPHWARPWFYGSLPF